MRVAHPSSAILVLRRSRRQGQRSHPSGRQDWGIYSVRYHVSRSTVGHGGRVGRLSNG